MTQNYIINEKREIIHKKKDKVSGVILGEKINHKSNNAICKLLPCMAVSFPTLALP
jgi:hypothetical protein